MGDVREPSDIAGLHARHVGDTVRGGSGGPGSGPAQPTEAATGDHRQGPEVLGLGVAAVDPDRVVLGAGLQRSSRQLHVLRVQGALHVFDSEAPGRHGVGVQPDAHGVELGAHHVDLRHARDGRHPLHQIAAGVVGQGQLVHRRGRQGHEDEGLGVGVGLGDLRRIGLIGQVRGDPRDGVAHVIGRVVQPAVQSEGNIDLRAAVAAGGIDPVDPLDAGDLLLDDLSDALLDHLGGGAPIVGADRHLGRIDVGQFAHR